MKSKKCSSDEMLIIAKLLADHGEKEKEVYISGSRDLKLRTQCEKYLQLRQEFARKSTIYVPQQYVVVKRMEPIDRIYFLATAGMTPCVGAVLYDAANKRGLLGHLDSDSEENLDAYVRKFLKLLGEDDEEKINAEIIVSTQYKANNQNNSTTQIVTGLQKYLKTHNVNTRLNQGITTPVHCAVNLDTGKVWLQDVKPFVELKQDLLGEGGSINKILNMPDSETADLYHMEGGELILQDCSKDFALSADNIMISCPVLDGNNQQDAFVEINQQVESMRNVGTDNTSDDATSLTYQKDNVETKEEDDMIATIKIKTKPTFKKT